MSLLDKVSNSKGISLGVARCETLVCLTNELLPEGLRVRLDTTNHVKEHKVLLALDQLAQLFPLLLGGVNTGWVLRASVQENLTMSLIIRSLNDCKEP